MLRGKFLVLVGTAMLMVANSGYAGRSIAQVPPPDDPTYVEDPVNPNARSNPQQNTANGSTSFICGMSQFKGPTTIAQTPRGNVPIILWVSRYFEQSGFNPHLRCEIVSNRFQELYRNGSFDYITAGRVNNLPVICATKENNGDCNNDNTLFTLEANDNPSDIIKELQAIRSGASSGRVLRRGGKSINLRDFVNNAPVEPGTLPNNPMPKPTTPGINQPSPAPTPDGRIW